MPGCHANQDLRLSHFEEYRALLLSQWDVGYHVDGISNAVAEATHALHDPGHREHGDEHHEQGQRDLCEAAYARGGCLSDSLRSCEGMHGNLLQLADALSRADDVCEADTELLIDHDYFAVRDERTVHKHVERFAGGAVELHD